MSEAPVTVHFRDDGRVDQVSIHPSWSTSGARSAVTLGREITRQILERTLNGQRPTETGAIPVDRFEELASPMLAEQVISLWVSIVARDAMPEAVTVTSPHHEVTVQIEQGRIVTVQIDAKWAKASAIQAVSDCVNDTLAKAGAHEDPAPNPSEMIQRVRSQLGAAPTRSE